MWHRRETRRQTEKTKLNLRTGSNLPTHPILSFLMLRYCRMISDASLLTFGLSRTFSRTASCRRLIADELIPIIIGQHIHPRTHLSPNQDQHFFCHDGGRARARAAKVFSRYSTDFFHRGNQVVRSELGNRGCQVPQLSEPVDAGGILIAPGEVQSKPWAGICERFQRTKCPIPLRLKTSPCLRAIPTIQQINALQFRELD